MFKGFDSLSGFAQSWCRARIVRGITRKLRDPAARITGRSDVDREQADCVPVFQGFVQIDVAKRNHRNVFRFEIPELGCRVRTLEPRHSNRFSDLRTVEGEPSCSVAIQIGFDVLDTSRHSNVTLFPSPHVREYKHVTAFPVLNPNPIIPFAKFARPVVNGRTCWSG